MSKIPDSIQFAVPRPSLKAYALEKNPDQNYTDLSRVGERFQATDAPSAVILEKSYPALSAKTIDQAHQTYEAGSKRCQVAASLMGRAACLGLMVGCIGGGAGLMLAEATGAQLPWVKGIAVALTGGTTAALVAQRSKLKIGQEESEKLKAMGPYLDHGQGQFHQFLDAYQDGKVQQQQAQMMVNPPPTVLATYQAGQGPEGVVLGERKPF